MRVLASLLAFLSVLGLVAAQLPPGTPGCAIPCLVEGIAASPCQANITCLCMDQTFISTMETCVQEACIVEDALLVKNLSATACGIEPQNISPLYMQTSAIMSAIALFFTILRVVYRQWITKLGLGADDWTTIVAALSCIPATVLNARLADFGVGRDIWTLTPYQITMFGQTFWFLTMIYFLDMALLKLSILFFFLRIFPDRKFRRIVWVTLVIVGLFGLAYVLAAMFQCWPMSYNWTRWNDRDHQGYCVDYSDIAWANAATSITLDLWMLYLPLSQISSLKLDWRKKIGISAMFMVGTFVTVVSILRLASILQFSSSENITLDTTAIATWSTVEICTGVICACMPSMRLVLARLWPDIFGSTTTTNASSLYPRGGNNPLSSKPHTGTGTGMHSSRFSGFGRPTSFYSSQQPGGGSAATVDTAVYPARVVRAYSTDDDAIQLTSHASQKYPGTRSSSGSSDLNLPRHGTVMGGGIHVTTSVEVKY